LVSKLKKIVLFHDLQTLYGDVESAYKTILNYYSVWKRYGGTPEFFSVSHSAPVQNREGYPLRPGRLFKPRLWRCLWNLSDKQMR